MRMAAHQPQPLVRDQWVRGRHQRNIGRDHDIIPNVNIRVIQHEEVVVREEILPDVGVDAIVELHRRLEVEPLPDLSRMERISPGMRSSYSSSVFTRRQVSCALCLVSRSSIELGLNSSPALILSVSFMSFPPLWLISDDVTGYILIIIYHAAPLLSSVFCRFRKKS